MSDDGLLDWTNTSRLSLNHAKLQDHHIFPKAYLRKKYRDQPEILEMADTVANRALIPKLTNLKIGSKPPSRYLGELLEKNPALRKSLRSHKIDDEIILNDVVDDMFSDFIRHRAQDIFNAVKQVAVSPLSQYLPPQESGVTNEVEASAVSSLKARMRSRPNIENSDVNVVEIPVFAEYSPRGSEESFSFKADLVLNGSEPRRSKIRVNGQLLKPSPAGLAKIHTVNSTILSVNGWTFWMLRDPRNSEVRFIKDLRTDESLVRVCLAHFR